MTLMHYYGTQSYDMNPQTELRINEWATPMERLRSKKPVKQSGFSVNSGKSKHRYNK